MTERERLIRLLDKYFGVGDSDFYICNRVKEAFALGTMRLDDFSEIDEENTADIADYLLAKGVILSPVKVGDKVYVNPYTLGYLSFIDYEHCFIHSEHFVIAEVVSIIKTRKQNIIKLKIYNKTTCSPKYKRYPISSIGITVFLTKEDAEKALKDKKKE